MVAPTSVKRGQVEPDRAGRRALADHDVELEVLHRRIEHLLDRAREAVDLVDEQHVAVVEVGEDRGEVAGALERGPARDPQRRRPSRPRRCPARLVLPSPGRAREQQVVDGLAALACRAPSRISRCSFSRGWPTNSSSRRGPERRLLRRLDRIGARAQQLFPAHALTSTARRLSASRRRSSTGAVVGEVGRARRAPRRARSRARSSAARTSARARRAVATGLDEVERRARRAGPSARP